MKKYIKSKKTQIKKRKTRRKNNTRKKFRGRNIKVIKGGNDLLKAASFIQSNPGLVSSGINFASSNPGLINSIATSMPGIDPETQRMVKIITDPTVIKAIKDTFNEIKDEPNLIGATEDTIKELTSNIGNPIGLIGALFILRKKHPEIFTKLLAKFKEHGADIAGVLQSNGVGDGFSQNDAKNRISDFMKNSNPPRGKMPQRGIVRSQSTPQIPISTPQAPMSPPQIPISTPQKSRYNNPKYSQCLAHYAVKYSDHCAANYP